MVVQKTLADKLQWSFHYWKDKVKDECLQVSTASFFWKTDFSFQCWDRFKKKNFPKKENCQTCQFLPPFSEQLLKLGRYLMPARYMFSKPWGANGHVGMQFSVLVLHKKLLIRSVAISCAVSLETCRNVYFPASSIWDHAAVLLTQLRSGLPKPVNWRPSVEILFFVVCQNWLQFNSYLSILT